MTEIESRVPLIARKKASRRFDLPVAFPLTDSQGVIVNQDRRSLSDRRKTKYGLDDARPVLERALSIQEEALAPADPQLATSLGALGNLLLETGDYPGARTYYERALEIEEAAYGPDDPALAFRLYNLAILLAATGFQVLRIHNEETFLRRYDEYADYMQRTKWRVIPLVW